MGGGMKTSVTTSFASSAETLPRSFSFGRLLMMTASSWTPLKPSSATCTLGDGRLIQDHQLKQGHHWCQEICMMADLPNDYEKLGPCYIFKIWNEQKNRPGWDKRYYYVIQYGTVYIHSRTYVFTCICTLSHSLFPYVVMTSYTHYFHVVWEIFPSSPSTSTVERGQTEYLI